MGAHTTSDDPTKYREHDDVQFWSERDPIARFETFLRAKGESEEFFAEVATEAEDLAADIRARTVAVGVPPTDKMFAVYSDPHPLMDEQRAWLAAYEESLDEVTDHG